MWLCFYLLLSICIVSTRLQTISISPSTAEDNPEDIIIQIFNRCKCVIFYLCDEQNYIIPSEELKNTKVNANYSLRTVRRLTCSNNIFFCCKNKTEVPSSIPVCGKTTGLSARLIDKFPWMVAIYEKRKGSSTTTDNYSFTCSGTLIHPRVVLTAQHCVRSIRKNMLKVTVKNETADPSSMYSRSISKIVRHGGYYSGALHNDIALLILEEPLVDTSPVCLPQAHQQFGNKKCVAVSWEIVDVLQGKSRMLQKFELPIIEPAICQNLLKTNLSDDFTLHSSAMCTASEDGEGVHQGSGGAPLLCQNDHDSFIQVGITSWGSRCCGGKVIGVYADVVKLRGWIDEELKKENLSLGI